MRMKIARRISDILDLIYGKESFNKSHKSELYKRHKWNAGSLYELSSLFYLIA